MNKNMIFGIIGFLAGVGTGILVTKKYFEKRADEEIESVKAALKEKLQDSGEAAQKEYGASFSEDEDEVNPVKNDLSEIQEKLKKNYEQTTNYAKMYKNEEPEEEEDPYEGSESQKMNEEHERNRNRPPRIISFEEAGNLGAHVGAETLFFYTDNDTVTDEDGNVIQDYPRLLGDCLLKYDFIHSDEELIFVMNYELDVCYEVQKIMDEYVAD